MGRRRMPIAIPAAVAALALISLLAGSCRKIHVLHRKLSPPLPSATVNAHSPYLKAHLMDGGLLVLEQWFVDDGQRRLTGRGTRYNPRRDVMARGPLSLPLDSAVLLETNTLETYRGMAVLRTMAGMYAVGDLLCAANPKACFGSCPTFYTLDGAKPVLQAEGFSASVAPCLEADDLDAFCRPCALPTDFVLDLRNEALETHAIRCADLILVPRAAGEEVFKDDAGRFWSGVARPAIDLEAAGLVALAAKDGLEWFDRADSLDLGARRTLELEFPHPAGPRLGLVVCGRQSLLTTFVFYQALAWMGGRAGDYLAALERGDLRWDGCFEGLAQVRVTVRDGRAWREAGSFTEVGPLALDEHVVILPDMPQASDGLLRVRVEFTRGGWRLDRVALASLRPAEAARRLSPVAVTRGGSPAPEALAALRDPACLLMTEPGDAYQLHYQVPGDLRTASAFLDSRGWYLEWMREAWLKEESPGRLAQLLRRPERGLRELAPAYKAVEAQMDEVFWNSRYAK